MDATVIPPKHVEVPDVLPELPDAWPFPAPNTLPANAGEGEL